MIDSHDNTHEPRSGQVSPTADPYGRSEPGVAHAGRSSEPRQVTEAFLAALRDEDAEGVMALLDDDIVYANKGLPVLRGRRRVERVFRLLDRPAIGFDTCVHSIAAEGSTVLTERTDIHRIGPVVIQFWVCGRYDVHDGRLTLLREYFDLADIVRGAMRGLVALALPGLAAVAPKPDTAPGRPRATPARRPGSHRRGRGNAAGGISG